jgi:hypothetical protein
MGEAGNGVVDGDNDSMLEKGKSGTPGSVGAREHRNSISLSAGERLTKRGRKRVKGVERIGRESNHGLKRHGKKRVEPCQAESVSGQQGKRVGSKNRILMGKVVE